MPHDHSEKPAHQRICRLKSCRQPFLVCVDCDPTDRRAYCSEFCRKLADKEAKERYRHSFEGRQKQSACSKRNRDKKKQQQLEAMESGIAPDRVDDSRPNKESQKKEREGYFFPLRFLQHFLMIMLTVSLPIITCFLSRKQRCRFCHAPVRLVEVKTPYSAGNFLCEGTHGFTHGY